MTTNQHMTSLTYVYENRFRRSLLRFLSPGNLPTITSLTLLPTLLSFSLPFYSCSNDITNSFTHAAIFFTIFLTTLQWRHYLFYPRSNDVTTSFTHAPMTSLPFLPTLQWRHYLFYPRSNDVTTRYRAFTGLLTSSFMADVRFTVALGKWRHTRRGSDGIIEGLVTWG